MRLDKPEHQEFLLALLTNPEISVPLSIVDVVLEVRVAVEAASIGTCACVDGNAGG